MSAPPSTAVPALFNHCVDAYHEMLNQASREMIEGKPGMVYKGFLVELICGRLNLSRPYYTNVTKALKKMGCARQLKRGGSSGESIWLLINEPTLEKFERANAKETERTRYVTAEEHASVRQQVSDLNDRLFTIEKAMGLREEE